MNICFVCFGNICRSPMAEYIFKYLLNQEGITTVKVTSAGTNAHGHTQMSKGTREQLQLYNIPFDNTHRSVLFTKKTYDNNDLIIVMDNYNLDVVANRVQTNEKIKLMRSFWDGNKDVFDPYNTNKYNVTFEQIYNCCQGLLQHVKELLK